MCTLIGILGRAPRPYKNTSLSLSLSSVSTKTARPRLSAVAGAAGALTRRPPPPGATPRNPRRALRCMQRPGGCRALGGGTRGTRDINSLGLPPARLLLHL
mmetsp:Transcript_46798/g.151984  ORF Transcript_46798/g.151984 Transcript_46798/m.151984 type:complete len:101 (-) Transcript_46798:1072-1374(-)